MAEAPAAAVADAPGLALEGVGKRFDAFEAVREVSLSLPKGALLALLGPSGCGKTTLLRMIAGFVEPTAGRIAVGGDDVTALAPEKRRMGMVFQNYALFPHMTVRANVAFGLELRGVRGAELERRVRQALELVKLDWLAGRYPSQLSGGQQQRAALARVIAIEPVLLLLDEPFGALDRNLRESMQVELRKLQQSLHITTVVVTHDQSEAWTLADRVAVMNAGRVEQLGAPEEIYDRPATPFVAGFTGVSNLVEGMVEPGEGGPRLRAASGSLLPLPAGVAAGAKGTFGLRPEHVRLASEGGIPARVSFESMQGGMVSCEFALEGGSTLLASVPRDGAAPRPGDAVRVTWDPEKALWWPATSA